jgi:hypothetical protein
VVGEGSLINDVELDVVNALKIKQFNINIKHKINTEFLFPVLAISAKFLANYVCE